MDRNNRRRRNWALVAVSVLLIVVGRLSYIPERQPTTFFELHNPGVIAYWGSSRQGPANTMSAFEQALSMGADILYVDVRLSANDKLVIFADESMGRVNTDTIADTNAEPPTQQTYPLARVLKRLPGQQLILHIRQSGSAIMTTLCQVLQRSKGHSSVLVAAQSDGQIKEFRHLCPGVGTIAGGGETNWFLLLERLGLARWFNSKAQVLILPTEKFGFSLVNRGLVVEAKRWGLAVIYADINDATFMARVIATGADGIITNRADMLLNELGRSRL